MTVAMKPTDGQAIRKLIPLTTLSATVFEKLCAEIQIEEGPKGTVLFRQGDQKNEFVYLLNGTISLQAAGMEMDTITGGAEAARFALAHQIPRKVFAVAKNKVRFVRIKAALLNASTVEVKPSQSYEVSDMPDDASGDWMTTLLQSPIFQQLPAANLQKVLRSMEEIEVKAGENVISQGESGDFYFIIKKGRCTLTRKPSPHAKEIKLAELQTTDTFGEDSLISGEPRNVSISMRTDGVLLRLNKENFLNLIKEPVIQHVDITQAIEEYKRGGILLDVRTPDIFEQGHVTGSTNIPFFSLRMQIGNLDPKAKNIVICEDGNTSEAATFQLIRHGLQAVVLEGGFNNVPEEFLDAQPRQSSTNFAQAKLGDTKEPEAQSSPVAPQDQIAGKTVKAANQALADAKSIIAQLQQQLKTEKDKRLSAEQGNASVASDQAQQVKMQQQLEQKIAELEKSNEQARKDASDLKTQRDAASLKLTTAQRTQANTDSDSEKQQLVLKNELDAAKSEISTHSHKLEQSTSDLKAASDTLESLRREYDSQKKTLTKLENTLSNNQTAFDKESAAKKVNDANLSRIKSESSDKIARIRQELEETENQQSSLEESIDKLEKDLGNKNASYELLSKQKQELENAQNGKVETLLSEKQGFEKDAADFKIKLEQALADKDKASNDTADQFEKLETNLEAANELLKSQKTDSETDIAALNEKLVGNKESYEDLNSRKEELESEQSSRIDSLLAEKQALDKEITELKPKLDQVLTDKDKLDDDHTQKLQTLENELESAKKQLEEQQTDSDNAIAELNEELLRNKESHELLQKQKQELETDQSGRLESLLSEKQAFEKELSDLKPRLERELKEKNDFIKESEQRIDALSKERDTIKTSRDKFGSERDKIKSDKEHIQSELEDQQIKQQDSEQAQVESETKLKAALENGSDLENTIEELTKEHVAYQEEADDKATQLNSKIAELEQNLADIRSEKNKTDTELEKNLADITKLKSEQDKKARQQGKEESVLRDENTKLRSTIENLEKELSETETTLGNEIAELASLRAQIDESATDSEALQKRLDELSTSHAQAEEAAKTKQNDLSKTISDLEHNNAELERVKDSTISELEDRTAEVESLSNRLENVKAVQQALESDIAKLSEDRETDQQNAQQQQQKLDEEISNLLSQQSELESGKSKLSDDLQDKDQQVTELNNQLDTISSDRDELEAQITRLSEHHAESESQAKSNEEELSERIEALQHQQADLESEKSTLTSELEEKDKEAKISTEQLDDALKKHSTTQDELNALTELHEQSVEDASNEHSSVSEKLSEIQQQLDSSSTELESTQNELQTVSDARDALEQNKNQLEQENRSLRQDVENIDKLTAELNELQANTEQQRTEFEQREESYKLRAREEYEKQGALKDEVAAFTAEASEIQERLSNKTQDLSDLETKLFAIRKENAILERHMEEMSSGDPDHLSSTSQLNELRSNVGDLEEKYSIAQKEKRQAQEQVNALLEQNTELKSVVQEFMDQAENTSSGSDPEALQAELEMVREQASQDVEAMQKQLTDSEKETERLRRELQAERQRAADLEEATNSPLSISTVLTPVDQDVFSMLDDDEDTEPKSPQTIRAGWIR